MTKAEVVKELDKFNRWRRGEDIPQPEPKKIGIAIDRAIELLSKKK